MGRWLPGAQERLVGAALELYAERGFDRTTATEIAERAGVTERTFFRYFADKREVLFAGGHLLETRMSEGIAAADDDLSALDAAVEGLAEAVGAIEWEFARRRSGVISGSPALQERELLKLESMSAAAAEGLRARGVADLAASIAGESAVTIFKLAFARWIAAEGPGDLPATMRSVLAELRATVAG